MMPDDEFFDQAIDMIAKSAGGLQYREVPEELIVSLFRENHGDWPTAGEAWEALSPALRKPIVRQGNVIEWNFVRRVVCVSKLPTADGLERIAELYALSTPQEIDRRIRALSGFRFEHFLGELLNRIPQFRGIVVTQPTRDGGIDFRGKYSPQTKGPEWVLIGQAKQVAAAVSAREARDFIGALDTCGEAKAIGLFVSTAGFTEPAHEVLKRSRFQVIVWGVEEIRERVFEASVGIRKLEISLQTIDETFWDELGDPSTS